jgi:hypothetical protein
VENAERTAALAVPAAATPAPTASDPPLEATVATPPAPSDRKVTSRAVAPTPGSGDANPPSASSAPRQGEDASKAPSPTAGEPRANAADLDARIAALERQIAGDEESLKALLSEVPAPGAPELATRPEFREIALRLPKLQAELRTLQDQRARHTEP